MIKLTKEKTKALVSLHRWTGIGIGLLLYAVTLTGVVAVLADEIGIWSTGGGKNEPPFSFSIEGIVSDLSKRVDSVYLENVELRKSVSGDLQIFFHTHKKNGNGELDDYGVQFDINAATEDILNKQTGFHSELVHNDKDSALSRFFVDIHKELHLPRPWGLLLTGILGLGMLVAAVSAFLMHRHLLIDLFVIRRQRSELLKKRDLHTVAGTWGLPFAFILAFTGSFFSFAGAFGIPAMAMVAFEGDQEALVRTLVGIPETANTVTKPMHNIDNIVKNSTYRAGNLPQAIAIIHYGRGDAKMLLTHPAKAKSLEPIKLEYNAVTGAFVREKPALGGEPSAGSSAFVLMGSLHFGNFAGLLSKLTWVALGIGCCYTVMSGLSLWLQRRQNGNRWKPFERVYICMGTGLPLAMSASAIGYFLNPNGDTVSWVPASFLMVTLVVCVLTLLSRDTARLQRLLLAALALCLFSLPLIRVINGGVEWGSALRHHQSAVVVIDVLIVLAGIYVASMFTSKVKRLSSQQQYVAVVEGEKLGTQPRG